MLGWLPRPTIGPLAARRSRALSRRAAPDALALLGAAPQTGWRVGEPLAGRGYATVFAVHHGDDSPALLKATDTERGHAELQREVDALAALHADARLDGWAELLPRTLAVGDVDDVHFVLESRLPGADVRAMAPGAERDRMVHRALDAIVELQARTATVAPIGDDDIDRWVHDPAEHLRAVLPGRTRPAVTRWRASWSVRCTTGTSPEDGCTATSTRRTSWPPVRASAGSSTGTPPTPTARSWSTRR